MVLKFFSTSLLKISSLAGIFVQEPDRAFSQAMGVASRDQTASGRRKSNRQRHWYSFLDDITSPRKGSDSLRRQETWCSSRPLNGSAPDKQRKMVRVKIDWRMASSRRPKGY